MENYTKEEVKKLLKEQKEQIQAEVAVKTHPLLTLSFWAEKFGYKSRQAFHQKIKKYYPQFLVNNTVDIKEGRV